MTLSLRSNWCRVSKKDESSIFISSNRAPAVADQAMGVAHQVKAWRTIVHKCGQATKGAWWMPRRLEAMKDVAACDKLGGAGKLALIPRCPNGETRYHWATR